MASYLKADNFNHYNDAILISLHCAQQQLLVFAAAA